MKLLIFILNNNDILEKLLKAISSAGIRGGTTIESKGMGRQLSKTDDSPLFGSIRKFFNPDRENNTTLLFALNEEQVKIVVKIINEIVGDLSKPNTGILFVLPIEYVEGLVKIK